MAIIKEAFTEGRETKVKWKDSEAKKNELKLEIFSHNVENFNGRAFMKPIRLQRIDPTNGKVLDEYPSRIDAARWICRHVLKRDDVETKAVSITGNMHMSITNGWKAYGFYWKYIDAEKALEAEQAKALSVVSNARSIWTYETGATGGDHHRIFASITEAVKYTKISKDRIRRAIDAGGARVEAFSFQSYNPTLKTVEYKNLRLASKSFGISGNTMKKYIAEERPINNIIVTLPDFTRKVVYALYANNKLTHEFSSLNKLARELQLSKKEVERYLNTNIKIHTIYRCATIEKIISKKWGKS